MSLFLASSGKVKPELSAMSSAEEIKMASLSDDDEDEIDMTSTNAPDKEFPHEEPPPTLPLDTSTSSIVVDADDENEDEPSEAEPSSSSPSFEETKNYSFVLDTSIVDVSLQKDDDDSVILSQDSGIESQLPPSTLNTSQSQDTRQKDDDETKSDEEPETEQTSAPMPSQIHTAGPSTAESLAELGLSPHEINKQLQREATARNKREVEEEERERMQVLVSNFTEDQLDRYEMYRRAAFPKAAIKRLMQVITGNSVSQNAVIAMSGIAKVFIGEIVEEALDVEERWGDSGPIQPKHIREAVRILRQKRGVPKCNTYRMNPYHL